MINYNSKEEIDKRASQEDPIVMYLIVNEELNMSIGKTGAQCAHGAQILLLKNIQEQKDMMSASSPYEQERFDLFNDWLNNSFRKVVLKASKQEWNRLIEELPINDYSIVIDAGLTEIATGSNTVLAVMPMYKSKVPKCIKRLQLLK